MTIQQTIDIPANRRIHLDFDLPADAPSGLAELKLTLKAKDAGRRIPFVSWLLGRRRERQTKALMDFYGCLKDSPALEGDSVEIVRKWRDEWDRPWDQNAGEA